MNSNRAPNPEAFLPLSPFSSQLRSHPSEGIDDVQIIWLHQICQARSTLPSSSRQVTLCACPCASVKTKQKLKSGALKRSWCSTWLFPTPHKWWLSCSLTSARAQSAHAVRQQSAEWNKRLTGLIETPSLLHSPRTGECHLPHRIPNAPPGPPVGQPRRHVAVTAWMPPQAGADWLLLSPTALAAFPPTRTQLGTVQHSGGVFSSCAFCRLWFSLVGAGQLLSVGRPCSTPQQGFSGEAHNEPIGSLNNCNALTPCIKIFFFTWVVMVLLNERESLLCGYKWTKRVVQAHLRLTEMKGKPKTSNVCASN